jgi:hypothetical protein
MSTNEGKGPASSGAPANDPATTAGSDEADLAKKVSDAMNGGKDAPASMQGKQPADVTVSATSTGDKTHVEVDVGGKGSSLPSNSSTDGGSTPPAADKEKPGEGLEPSSPATDKKKSNGKSSAKPKAKTEKQIRDEVVANAQIQTAEMLQKLPEVIVTAVTTSNQGLVDSVTNLAQKVDDNRIDTNNRINGLADRLDQRDEQAVATQKVVTAQAKSNRNWALVVVVVLVGLIIWAIMANNRGLAGIKEFVLDQTKAITNVIGTNTTAVDKNTTALNANSTAVDANTKVAEANGKRLTSIDGTLTNINRDMVLNPTAEHRRRLASLQAELSDVNAQIAELESRKSGIQVTYGGRLGEAQDKLAGLEGFVKAKAARGEELRSDDRADLVEVRAKIVGLEAERDSKLSEITKQIDVLKKRQADLQEQLKELQNPKPAQASSDGKAQPTLSEIKSGQEEIKALFNHDIALSRQAQKDSHGDLSAALDVDKDADAVLAEARAKAQASSSSVPKFGSARAVVTSLAVEGKSFDTKVPVPYQVQVQPDGKSVTMLWLTDKNGVGKWFRVPENCTVQLSE